jgi:membrane associated rhomboid family serine protease
VTRDKEPRHVDFWVALILAAGLTMAINCFALAMLWEAIRKPEQAGLSENATQVLTGAFGGIIGILGAYFGYHKRDRHLENREVEDDRGR